MRKIIQFSMYVLIVGIIFITCSKDDSPEPTTTPPPAKVTYALSSSVSPDNGGTVSPASGTYDKGEKVTLTATPNTNYEFKNWSGGATGTDNPITVTFNGDKSITAVFEEVPPVYKNGEGEIGTLGGTVMVEDASSPLNGVIIEIPEGALDSKVNIKISLEENDIRLSNDKSLKVVKFEPDGLNFKKPITIGLPYEETIQDSLNVIAINFIPESNKFIELEKIRVDDGEKIIYAKTNHFSDYAAIPNIINMDFEITSTSIQVIGNIKKDGNRSILKTTLISSAEEVGTDHIFGPSVINFTYSYNNRKERK